MLKTIHKILKYRKERKEFLEIQKLLKTKVKVPNLTMKDLMEICH